MNKDNKTREKMCWQDKLHTPKELCRHCSEWVTEKIPDNDLYPGCAAQNFRIIQDFLLDRKESCVYYSK